MINQLRGVAVPKDEPQRAGQDRPSPDATLTTSSALGVVFCGGRSRRMGADKARLEVGGRDLLEHAIEALRGPSSRVVLACGPRARYRERGLELVLDGRADGGPLAGLEAALGLAAADGQPDWILALACDMPRARGEVFGALLAHARARGADACLLTTSEGPEPLMAVYRASCLSAVRAALDAGERRMIAFHQGYGPLRVETVALEELPMHVADEGCVRNVNTPDELRREREDER